MKCSVCQMEKKIEMTLFTTKNTKQHAEKTHKQKH